ncbi:MAG: exosortase/archaeosortase family protein [Armatimonadota bacterium]|nr:exosortase/archaeosortase family protein [Armatimonadota bacterium]MDR7439719.1 exosortase/archaeosortase family protein [Armatimonadota bacterium]MDR7568470.1 exosortase/archaeosortase family protein [Armatimonadota bacterium]MDR7602452.1 exosortase/archaeosortase family protein [Armatimonadota bacterium]
MRGNVLRAGAVMGVGGLVALLGWLYAPVLRDMAAQWAVDTTYGYGYYIPPVAAYLVWDRRRALRAIRPEGTWTGLPILLVGLGALVLGRAGGIALVARASLIPVLFGLVLLLGGWRVARVVAFPILFLALMIPIPQGVLQRITWPLQIFTAQFSTEVLRLLGYPVYVEGIYIDLPNVRLEVAEACSGFRSLVALTATGILLAHLTQERWRERVVLVGSVVPIAILANAVRVTSNIGLGIYEGTYHTVSGWMVFVAATAMLVGVSSALGRGVRAA